jgi:hypothetical protein
LVHQARAKNRIGTDWWYGEFRGQEELLACETLRIPGFGKIVLHLLSSIFIWKQVVFKPRELKITFSFFFFGATFCLSTTRIFPSQTLT